MSRAALWDEVWAEYDARHPQEPRPAPAPTPVARPPSAEGLGPQPLMAPRLRPWRLAALGMAAVALAYTASPLAAAVQLASAVQRGDAAVLTTQADWERLRPGIEARLEAVVTERLEGPTPAFVRHMQTDLAARLASPEGLGALLGGMPGQRAAPAHEWLQGAQPLEGGRWNVTLARPDTPARATTVTLELQDPLRLRWQVVGVGW